MIQNSVIQDKFNLEKPESSIPVNIMEPHEFEIWLSRQPASVKNWIVSLGFDASPGQLCPLPDTGGRPGQILVGKDQGLEVRWTLARVAASLRCNNYHLTGDKAEKLTNIEVLSWSLADNNYKNSLKNQPENQINRGNERTESLNREKTESLDRTRPRLLLPQGIDRLYVQAADKAIRLARHLISLPANLLPPSALADCAVQLFTQSRKCEQYSQMNLIVGHELMEQNFPAIYHVGQAAGCAGTSENPLAPRLIDLRWRPVNTQQTSTGNEEPELPKLVLIGKGVCFDTGGLNLKPANGMRLMKKDMGGAAHVLALASMIMDLDLPVDLRVLIPAVENSVSGSALHPGDVIKTRKGLSVEIGNTDAEGRLILADALTCACEASPDLLIDFATLTGAARIALGPDVPAFFCNDNQFAHHMANGSEKTCDPTWRLPLHAPYASSLTSHFADCNNISESMPLAGAITAALFLQKFISPNTVWAHLDLMGYNSKARPGRPVGGEAMGLLASFEAIKRHFSLT